MTEDEADELIIESAARAEAIPEIELTPESWNAEFGNGVLTTPIGDVKISDNQYSKTVEKGRAREFGMIRPTLTNPDFIIEVDSEAKDGQSERPTSYLFVKAFIGKDGKKQYFFKSVTVQRDGMEVNVSNHFDRPKRVRESLEKGKLLYRFDGGAQTEQSPATVSVTTPQTNPGVESEVYTRPALESGTDTDSSGVNRGQTEGATATSRNSPSTSEGKVTNNSSNLQEKTEKSSPLGKTSSPEQIAEQEAKVDTNPTEGQKEAGNYQKGHIKVDGLDITIENPKGSVRSGVDADGNPWEVTMNNTYGYIRGTESVDGDHIDVFLGDDPTSGNVYVVDQVKPDGSFDEVKVMYGFKDAAEATQAYLSNYGEGWKGLGAISGVSREAFKEWIESSHRKTKPFREYALAKREQAREAKENENKLNNDDVISDIDENDVPLQKRSRKSYTDREGVYHEGLEEELQNIEQTLRQMVEGTAEEGNGESKRRTPAELRRRASIIRAELAGRQRAREELRQKYNINEKGDISLDDLTRMFRDLNSDEAIGRLFERVLNVLKNLKLNYRFTDKLPGGVNGRAQTLLNMTFYDWDAQTRDMDDQQKARVLLHEMIHNVTSQILLYARNMPLLLALSPKQLSAARKLNSIYKEVKKASPKRANGKDFYALDSVDEMVAELANPEFREALSQIEVDGRSLWQRIKDAIREIFGLETTPNMSNALKESGDVLEDILDTFGHVRSFVHGVPRQAMEAGEKIFGDNENLTDRVEADLQNSKGNDIQEELSLMGVHNISEEKLKKVIKAGGLANPSLAVIDTKQGFHNGYGEISLIPKSDMIDARTGGNAGTYMGDAYTPTYPTVETSLSDKGRAHIDELARQAAGDNEQLMRHLRGNLKDYVEGNGSRLHYLFLQQTGRNPQPVNRRLNYSENAYNELKDMVDGDILDKRELTQEESDRILNAMLNERYAKYGDKLTPERKEMIEKNVRSNDVGEDGKLFFSRWYTFMEALSSDARNRKNPQVDWYGTDIEAQNRVIDEKLSDEYEEWKKNLLNDEDVNEELFDGYTKAGYRRTVPNTVYNASRIMNKQGDVNAYDSNGIGATRATLLEKVNTLAQIRKNKGRIKVGNDVEQAVKDASDNLFEILQDISNMQKISDNHYMNIDYAEARLQEAFGKKDPLKHLRDEYGYDIDEDSDLGQRIKDFVQTVKKLPVKYFETKFKRPVGLDEFAVAVVPETTSPEVIEALKNAGLDVRTYDASDEKTRNENRQKVAMDAVNSRGDILFQKAEAEPEAPAQKERTLRDVLVDLLKSIGIDVIADNAEGQRTLDEANGKVSKSKVYHGSGAEFDAFDHSHMGEGEGSQAFGWGTYVTDSEGIGKSYAYSGRGKYLYKGKNWDKLWHGDHDAETMAALDVMEMMENGVSFTDAVERAKSDAEKSAQSLADDPQYKNSYDHYIEKIKALDNINEEDFSRRDNVLYDVEIPDDTGDNYLDWQEPVSDEVLEKVSDALTEQESDDVNTDYYLDKMDQFMDMNNPLGSDLYQMLQKYAFNGDAEKTSRFLGSIGFTGIKYPAGTIMGNGNGATNYVIFNEGDAKITNRTKFFRTKDGQAYGYTYNGKIYLDPAIATAETPVHEYTHLWAEAVRQKDPKTWDGFVDVLKNDPAVRPFWNKVAAQYPELTDVNDIAEEVLAQYSGKRGSERLREVADEIARENGGIFGRAQAVEALRKMKNILARFWKAVADVMGWHYSRADEIADEVLYDLLSGVKPETEGRAEVREQRVPGSERPDLNTPSQEVNEYNKRLERPEDFSLGKSIYMVPVKKTWRNYVGGRFREAWQDSMITLRRAQDIIAKVSGKPLQDYENAYAQENLSHGATKNEYEWFDRNLYKPLLKSFNALKKAMDAKDDAEVHRYMFAKHGLERNVVMAFRDAVKRHVQAAERDYESRKKAYDEAETRIKQKERNVENLEQLGFKEKAEEKRKELNRLKAAFERRKVPEKPQTEAEVHKAYQADEGRIQNEKDFREGRIDYRTYRERDDQIRSAYAPESYFILRSNDYSGLTGLFAETKEIDGVEVTEKPGVSEAENMALKLVDGIEKQHGPLTDDLWQKVNGCTKWTLQKSWQSGMLSRDSYDVISGMYDFYIPLRGWDGTNAQDVYDYVGGRNGVFSKAAIPAKGRTSVADNPIAYIGNMAMSNIIIGNQNRVKQCLLNLARNHPNELLRPDKAWYENIGDENNPDWVAVTPDIPEDATPEEINQILDEFNRRMRQLKADGKATQTRGSLHISYPAPDPQLKEHEVRVLEGGNEYIVYVNGDPRVAQAVNGTRARKVRNGSGLVTKLAERSGRFKAAVYTSFSPAFVISNWFRDITMAVTSSLIDKGIGYNATAAKNTAALLNPFYWPNNIFRMMWLYTHNRLNMQSPTQRMFKEFMMAGGETGFIAQLDLERFKDDISKELGRSGQHYYNPKKIFRGYLQVTEYLNRCIEDSTRFIVYKTSRQYGESILKSASDAKDVTLNFNRKGTGELGNAFVRGAYIFVNPSVQGIQTIARLVRNHPYKFTALAAGWIMGGAMQPYLNQMLMELLGPGDDDDRDAYWKLPEHVRRQCLVFYVGNGQFATIPLAQEFRALWGVGETASARLLGHGRGDYVDDGMEIVESFLDLLPLDVLGHGVRDLRFASREWFQAMGMNFVPDIIKTEVEGMANKDWSGKPLYKETENNRNLPSFAKAYKGTPDWLVRLTEFLNEHTGGEGSWKPGKVDWNPAIINHELQGWFGGPFNFFGGFGNDIYKAMNGKEVKIYDVPVLNRFVNMPSERDFSQNLGDEYWKMYREEYRPMDETFSQMKREARNGNAKALQAIENFFQSDDYKRYKEMKEQVDLAEKRKKAAEAGEGAFDFEYTNERAGKTPEQEYSERLNGKDEFEEWCVDQIGKKTAKYATELDNMRKNGASRQEQEEYRSRFALYIEAREAVERYSNERNGRRQALGKVDKESEEEIMNKIRSKRDELLRIYRFDDIFKKEE